MIKIIHTPTQNNSQCGPFLEQSVNYFENFEAECHLLKIGCRDSMEAVITNGVDFVTLLNSSNPSIKTIESVKDKPIYIRICTEILSQMRPEIL
jgi:hypothetical protein